MKFFPLTLHHKSTSTLLTVWSYWFLSPIGIEGNTHLIRGFTQSMVVLWDIMLFHTSSSFSDWLKCTDIDHRFQSIACLSSSMKSFSVTCPLSHFPVVWSIQSLPVRRPTSCGHSTAPDYIFIWSFAVSQWLSLWLCLTGMKVFKLSFSAIHQFLIIPITLSYLPDPVPVCDVSPSYPCIVEGSKLACNLAQ